MTCQDHCKEDTCCAKRILELQSDFQDQRSLIQEVIEEAGHECIFLPKFYCELNPIEFFWGSVKRYTRERCDCTFQTLKEKLPKAMESVELKTIRLWEHQMIRWMDAYRTGLGAKDAQMQVKAFSSRKYQSHHRIPENVVQQIDNHLPY